MREAYVVSSSALETSLFRSPNHEIRENISRVAESQGCREICAD
jgi:hypothetical protein